MRSRMENHIKNMEMLIVSTGQNGDEVDQKKQQVPAGRV